MAGFSIGPMLLLVCGHFSAVLGVPLGLAGAAVACQFAGLRVVSASADAVRCTVAAIAIAVVWVAVNIGYAAQDVYATRDPATYTITGRWLVDHGSLRIDTLLGVFGNPPTPHIGSSSFAVVAGDTLNAQGDHLLPALLGLSGRLFGTTALLHTNVVITALALLTFFGMARRVIGDRLAVLVMLALSVSMPIIYVGRDTYTEPLLLLFLMGALTFALRGWSNGRWQDWALAGLAGGAGTCVRVDSYGALLGLVAAMTLFGAIAVTRTQRRNAARCAAALVLGAATPAVLGWIDLTRLSQQYFGSQHGNIIHLVALLLAAVVVSPGVVWLLWQPRARAALGSARSRELLPRLAAVALAVTFLALVTRPEWQTTHGALAPDLVNMQKVSNVAQDGTRTYNEQTLRWQALYFGWPTIVLGFAGYGVLFADLVRRRAYQLVAVLGMGVPMSLLYLITSEVAPDQPWAMRRYVPVIIPLYLVAAAAALRWGWYAGAARRAFVRPVLAFLAAVLVGYPLVISAPAWRISEERGQLAQLDDICTAVGKHGAIITTDHVDVVSYNQTLRSFCDVPVVGLLDDTNVELDTVAAAVRAHGRVPYLLGQDPNVTGGQPGHAFSVVNVQRWPTLINETATGPDTQQYAVWLSVVEPDGRFVPVPPLTPGS
jgi:hypothetical protein